MTKPRVPTNKYNVKRSGRWSDEWWLYVLSEANKAGRAICGARTRSGKACRSKPMADSGRCRMHGAKSGRPPSVFIYSKFVKKAAATLGRADDMLNDPELLNLKQDVAGLRSLMAATLEEVDEKYELVKKYEADYIRRVETQKGLVKTVTRKGKKGESYAVVVPTNAVKRFREFNDDFHAATGRAILITERITKAIERFEKLEIAREYVMKLDEVEVVMKAHVKAVLDAAMTVITNADDWRKVKEAYQKNIERTFGKEATAYGLDESDKNKPV